MKKRPRLRRAALAAAVLSALAIPLLGAAGPSTSPVAVAPDPPESFPPLPEFLQPNISLVEEDGQLWRIADLTPARYRLLVLTLARQYQIDPLLIAAVTTVESHWNADAIGGHGEIGLMQILPDTARFVAASIGLTGYDLKDPATNLEIGTAYLAALIEQYGSIGQALAAYNGGPRAAHHGDDHPYARKVLRLHQEPKIAPEAPARPALPSLSAQKP